MNILQINDLDLAGRRFNGYDLNAEARLLGHSVCQCVLQKESDDPDVSAIDFEGSSRKRVVDIQQAYDLHSLLMPYGQVLLQLPEFDRAEVVHYHLIHNHILALPDFPVLTRRKPTVWTWHDPWAITGHCVHPQDCRGWEKGCSPCPYLNEYFPLKQDRAGELWKIKKQTYEKMDADIVVSSDFMLSLARNSPLGHCFHRVHKIPFGIQLDQFGQNTQAESRSRLKIPQEHFVIAFRNEKNPYKGIKYIEEMLRTWKNPKCVTLLTIGSGRIPTSLAYRFHCVQLGWVNDPVVLSDFYTACDVFLMPSIAESFGLMAIEAMASYRPVICFEGTALPAVTFAPKCGIAVPKGDVDMLRSAVKRLQEFPDEAHRRGDLGRLLSEENYSFTDYVRRHLELYDEIIVRRT